MHEPADEGRLFVTVLRQNWRVILLVLTVERILRAAAGRRDGPIRVVIVPVALQRTAIIRSAIWRVAVSDRSASILSYHARVKVHQTLS